MGAYHKTLGVPEGATEAQIKKAYRKLASELHPDKHVNKSEKEIETFKEKFQEVQAAYDGLTVGRAGPIPDLDINSEVEEMMRRWGAQTRSAGFQTRQPAIQTVEVPIATMFKGGKVIFSTMSPSSTGQGFLHFTKKTWNITLKPDTPVGHKVKVRDGKTETEFIVMSADAPACAVQGINLIMEKEIDLFDALIGGTIKVDHPSGTLLNVRVPAGVTNESVIRVNGKGMLNTNGTRGNLYIHASVKIPELKVEDVKILREAIKKIRKNKT